MTLANWLTLIGGMLLLAGVVIALVANHYETKVMGKARMGVALLAPQEDSSEWKEKERLVGLADRWFWFGVGLTALGILLQTIGSMLPI